ncbi:Uncharacterised protein [Bordetella trematum]|nr:Uncharacterised protein [Bordetella trematum]
MAWWEAGSQSAWGREGSSRAWWRDQGRMTVLPGPGACACLSPPARGGVCAACWAGGGRWACAAAFSCTRVARCIVARWPIRSRSGSSGRTGTCYGPAAWPPGAGCHVRGRWRWSRPMSVFWRAGRIAATGSRSRPGAAWTACGDRAAGLLAIDGDVASPYGLRRGQKSQTAGVPWRSAAGRSRAAQGGSKAAGKGATGKRQAGN